MSKSNSITVVGGGLAGIEAANQITKFGLNVTLFEMRPTQTTPAHKSRNLGELVCSNSLKSNSLENASGILKKEMENLDSLVINAAKKTSVPAGKALAVDRTKFADYITSEITKNPKINLIREEFNKLTKDNSQPIIIATGPLTSESLCNEIINLTNSKNLYFYDSISPIVDSDSLDFSKMFKASRYENSSNDQGDYWNCPLSETEYYLLVDEILRGEKVEIHEFEKSIYFESCLPVEVMCERGADTLRFGPLKPVGLKDPKTGESPFAVLQLRLENKEGSMYNLVGFQTKLRYPDQKRIFRKIPGLENAEFLRYGSIHRNTYINSPSLLNTYLQLKGHENIYFAGQITGVEGYVESAATGIIAGINAATCVKGMKPHMPPRESAIGSLLNYISEFDGKNFQPMNINFGLFPNINRKMGKLKKRELIAKNAIDSIKEFNPYG